MEQSLVTLNPAEFGLPEEKAKEINAVFIPMLKKMEELEKEFNEVINLPVSVETALKARELRLKYVKTRTGTAKIHKEAKAFYLAGSRFVDGWKNAQLFAAQGIESKLEAIENHFERIEKEKRDKLQAERLAEYLPLTDLTAETINVDLAAMPEEVYQSFITGAKKLKADKIEAEKKAEAERLEQIRLAEEAKAAKEKAEAEERARIEAENARLKKLADEKEAQLQKERAEAAKLEEVRIKAEQETQRKLKLEQERIEKEHQAKLEAEHKAQEAEEARLKAIIDAQAAKERARQLEEEVRIKKEKETAAKLKAQQEHDRRMKEEAERKALNAPDIEKLETFRQEIISLAAKNNKLVLGEGAKKVLITVLGLLEKTEVYLDKKIKEL